MLENSFIKLDNAKKFLNKFPIDVIFLDIEMPKNNGIVFYKSLNKSVKVIFTTAYSEYAVEGFNLNATDYLLKPFSLERFQEAVKRIQHSVYLETNHTQENTHLSIRADYKLHNIPINDILYIEAMDDYVKIHLSNNERLVARSTMKNILNKLPKSLFVRIHKSYIIPVKKVKTLHAQEVDMGFITLPVGNSYKKELNHFF